jgi:hypothetical protein
MTCTTHFNACDCREKEFEGLRRRLAEAVEIIKWYVSRREGDLDNRPSLCTLQPMRRLFDGTRLTQYDQTQCDCGMVIICIYDNEEHVCSDCGTVWKKNRAARLESPIAEERPVEITLEHELRICAEKFFEQYKLQGLALMVYGVPGRVDWYTEEVSTKKDTHRGLLVCVEKLK